MLHKAGKPEDLVKSYRFVSLTIADNLSNWAEFNSISNKVGLEKNRSTSDNVLKPFETVKFDFYKGHPTAGIFLDVEKAFDQV